MAFNYFSLNSISNFPPRIVSDATYTNLFEVPELITRFYLLIDLFAYGL